VTDRAGLGGEGLVGGPATALDIDGDGLLDVYIGYFGDYLHGVLPTFARRNTNAPGQALPQQGQLPVRGGHGQRDPNMGGRRPSPTPTSTATGAGHRRRQRLRRQRTTATSAAASSRITEGVGTGKPDYAMGDCHHRSQPRRLSRLLCLQHRDHEQDEKYVLRAPTRS
jgi:hypothetical protein